MLTQRARFLPFRLTLFLLTSLLACGPGSPGVDRAAVPRHVLLITVDTLRADHLGLYGYPRNTSPGIDAWAAGAVVFERAIAQWPKTGPSFASMFTGQYPQSTGLTHSAAIRVPDAYLTLPELLQENGFTTLAVVSNAVLSRETGWHRGFDVWRETWQRAPELSEDPLEYRKWINARIVNEMALELLAEHSEAVNSDTAQSEGERLFAWIHYSDPHAPYILPPDEPNPFVGDAHYTDAPDSEAATVKLHNPAATALGERRDLKHYVAAYDANVRFTDRHVAALLEEARRLDLLDDALVIFTSDHGESLGEHGYYFGHGRLPHQPGAHVPLIVAHPSLPGGRRIAAPVELVDLYPTLVEWLLPGRPPPELEGGSLLAALRGAALAGSTGAEATSPLAFSQAGGGGGRGLTHFRSVQDGRFKLVYHPPRPGHPTWQLFDLAADPGETRNLAEPAAAETLPELRRLHRALDGWMQGSDWIRRPAAEIEARSQETLKALKALGYIND